MSELEKEREHCETLFRQKLFRILGELSHRLSHEINETRLCLQGEPNLDMARERLDNMEEALAQVKKKI